MKALSQLMCKTHAFSNVKENASPLAESILLEQQKYTYINRIRLKSSLWERRDNG